LLPKSLEPAAVAREERELTPAKFPNKSRIILSPVACVGNGLLPQELLPRACWSGLPGTKISRCHGKLPPESQRQSQSHLPPPRRPLGRAQRLDHWIRHKRINPPAFPKIRRPPPERFPPRKRGCRGPGTS